jgi:hypothetical protein
VRGPAALREQFPRMPLRTRIGFRSCDRGLRSFEKLKERVPLEPNPLNRLACPNVSPSQHCRMKGRGGPDHCPSSEGFTGGSCDRDLAAGLGADVVNVLKRLDVSLICAGSMDYCRKRPKKNYYVTPQAPIANIPSVEMHTLFVNRITASAYLPKACDARPDQQII